MEAYVRSVTDTLKARGASLSAREHLRCYDAVSDVACALLDPAELCRSVHPAPEWRAAATDALVRLHGLFHELNVDRALYDALHAALRAPGAQLESAAERRLAELALAEFERAGVHLDARGRERARELNDQVTQLGVALSDAMAVGGSVHLHGAASDEHHNGHNDTASDSHAPSCDGESSVRSSGGGGADEAARRAHYVATLSSRAAGARVDALERLVRQRHALAQCLGAPSFAHLATQRSVAGEPARVVAFLERVAAAAHPRVLSELAELAAVKRRELAAQGASTDDVVVQAWDLTHLREHAVTDPVNSADVAEYFTLENCLRGLDMVAHELFGVRLRAVEPDESSELPSPGLKIKITVSNHTKMYVKSILQFVFNCFIDKDVIKTILLDAETDELLGVLYLDLFPREYKVSPTCTYLYLRIFHALHYCTYLYLRIFHALHYYNLVIGLSFF